MADETEEDDLRDVLREERSRGKKHVDTKAKQQSDKLRKLFLDLAYEVDDENDFWEAITALVPPGAEREQIVAAWRELKKRP